MIRTSRQFFRAESVGGNASPAAGAKGVAPAAGNPDAMPQAGAVTPDKLRHPMDARPASITDPDEENFAESFAKGSDNSPRDKGDSSEQRPSLFDEGFDVNALEPSLREPYSRMKEALDRRLSSVPDSDAMGALGAKAQAFDQLVRMPAFQEWASGQTGEVAEPSTDGGHAAQGAEDLLSGLDEDVRVGVEQYIQSAVDRAVAQHVTPLADSYFAREADTQLASIKSQYGEETFNRLVPTAERMMQSVDGLMAEEAFKLAHYDILKQQIAANAQKTIQRKAFATMETGDEGSANTSPARRTIRSPRDAFELALEQVGRGEGWDPRTDLTPRG